jgi:hypothetical protein
MSSEIYPKNIVIPTMEEDPREARRVFGAHRKATEERRKAIKGRGLQEFLTCFKKDRQGKITQVKEVILPSTSSTTEVTHNVSISAPSVTHEFVYDMLVDYYKNMKNQMQQMIEERIDKFGRNLDISYDSPTAHVNQHALNSSAIHVLPEFGSIFPHNRSVLLSNRFALPRISFSLSCSRSESSSIGFPLLLNTYLC